MHSRYYYAFDDSPFTRGIGACSRASDEQPLLVNCAGNIATALPFTTDNTAGREDYYLLYMAAGTMRLRLPDGEHTLTTGDTVLFPPHFPYHYVYEGGTPLSYLWVHFTGSYAATLLSSLGFAPLPCLHGTGQNDRIVSVFRSIFAAFEEKSRLQKHELAVALEQLLVTVALSITPEAESRTLERSVRYIHAAYNTDIRIPDLARMENLSNSRYIALFGKQMGVPPSAYIIRLRMGAARDLLHGTDMSVKQIGALVGYDDAHFFSRVFKKHVGISPQAFRSGTGTAK